MAKSTPSKKGATKKVATKQESASIEKQPSVKEAVVAETKPIKTVSIAKPKGLVAKVAKKSPEPVIEQIVKPAKKTSTKEAKKVVEVDSNIQSEEKSTKSQKTKSTPSKSTAKKTKTESGNVVTDGKKNLQQKADDSKEQFAIHEHPDTVSTPIESTSIVNEDTQNGLEKLSRKERRLREWKERKKLKKLQHLQEKQQGVVHAEPKMETATLAEAKEDVSENLTAPKEVNPRQAKQEPKKEIAAPIQKQVDQPSKVTPLDKVGKDFPPIQKTESWGKGMSKAKVDPLPKQLEPILQKTIQFLEQEIRIKKPCVMLCAVSGGIDSVVLLDLLAVISTRGWCTIHVAHCNHMLRGDASHQDEAFVKKMAAKYGLHFHHTQADVAQYAKEYNLGTEVAARIMRYQFFEKAAKASHADVIATAHHAEDNAETLLMNLMRGSGITGLAGIPPRRDVDKKLSYIRPILWLSKKEIEQYAKVRSLEWREDETNSSLQFTRNKIRHELLPLLRSEYSPGLTEVLNRTTTLMREAQEFISDRIIHIMKQGVREISKTSFAIHIGMFESIKDFAKGELIQASLRSFLHMQPISMNAIDSILAMVKGPAGGRLDITKDLFVVRDREELIFAKPETMVDIFMPVKKIGTFSSHGITFLGEIADPRTVHFGEHPLTEYFDADLLPEQLVVRYWRDGDRISPIGMDGSMTVSDFLTNAKINISDKRKVLVVSSADEVLWIVGYRIHNGFKVTQKTESIIRMKITLDASMNYLHQQEKQPKPSQKPVQKKSNEKSPKQQKQVVQPAKPLEKSAKQNETEGNSKKTKEKPTPVKKVPKTPKKP